MARRWQAAEITYLKRYAKGRTVEELRKRFRTSADEVESKLKDLGFSAKDSVGRARLANDPQVKQLERGIKLVHAEKFREAEKIFARIIKETDVRSIAQTARTYAAVCAEKAGGKSAQVDDPFLEAVYLRNQARLEEALEICKRGGRSSKDERFAYLAAAVHSAREEFDEAAKFLELSIELNPGNRIHAHHDEDFAGLRSHPEYSALFRIA